MADLRLSEIWIYPIKGLGGIRVQEAKVMEKGLEFDRRMMLVDGSNQFLTQRDDKRFPLFRPRVMDGRVSVTYDSETLFIDNGSIGEKIETMVWDDHVSVYEVNKEYSKWFSKHLGFECKLAAFPESSPRPVDPTRSINNENVSLADGYPFLILGQSSLDFLNAKLDSPLPINRFRPNLVFTGGVPHEEDSWREFTIGSNRFIGIKPCARCVVTTINQETAEKGVEPLKTFATYRKMDHEVYLGQNVVAVDYRKIREGDLISVSSILENDIAKELSKNLK